ncbi:MAG: YkgJ family cysteine cluster protein [Methylophilaceae bacterium]
MAETPITLKKLKPYISGQAKKAHSELDALMSEVPNVCKSGCSACCYQMVSVHTWEEELIIDYIKSSMHVKTKAQVRKQLLAWWRYLKSILRPSTRENPITQQEQKQLALTMIQNKVMCPFLVDSKCSIYPVRPAMCRAHVVTDAPERCATELGRVGDVRGAYNMLATFGAESEYLPFSNYPHAMKPLAFALTGTFNVPVPSTPMEGVILGDVISIPKSL